MFGLSVAAFYFPDYADYPKVTAADDGNVVSPLSFRELSAHAVRHRKGSPGGGGPHQGPQGRRLKQWGNIVPPFHWIATDRSGESIVIEPVGGKLVIHENPLGVITNSPTFDWHMTNLRNFIYLNPAQRAARQAGQNRVHAAWPRLRPRRHARGLHPPFPLRPARPSFRNRSSPMATGRDAVLQAFHILNQFDIPQGASIGMADGKPEADITQATIVADLKALKLYVTNYSSRRIKMIDLNRVDFGERKVRPNRPADRGKPLMI